MSLSLSRLGPSPLVGVGIALHYRVVGAVADGDDVVRLVGHVDPHHVALADHCRRRPPATHLLKIGKLMLTSDNHQIIFFKSSDHVVKIQ